jgi:hypothetical protein
LLFNEDVAIAEFLINVSHDFKQTMVEVNIWNAFQVLVFQFDTAQEL